MTTKAIIGHGSVFSIGDSTGGASVTYTPVTADVVNIGGVSFSRDALDATHLGSGGFKEYIAGLRDGGDLTLTFHYVPAATDEMYTHFNTGAIDARIIAPNGTNSLTFSAIVTGWSSGDYSSEKMEGTLTIKITGTPTFVQV